jgi:ribonuclease HI
VDGDSNSPAKIEHETWIIYFDGSVMNEGAGVGLVFISTLCVRMEYMVRLHFSASNNAAEYEALINSLRIAVELGIKRLEIRGDVTPGPIWMAHEWPMSAVARV